MTTPAPATTAPQVLIVPDVHGQAFVFAKGMIQDAGFAWHVTGSVSGYAVDTVATQRPEAGTRVVDTGAPVMTLTLARNPHYKEHGQPENNSPYPGTALRLAPISSRADTASGGPGPRPHDAGRAEGGQAGREASREAERQDDAQGGDAPARLRGQGRAEGAAQGDAAHRARQDALRLGRRRTGSRQTRNVRYWLYQHAWIVTGAGFGWWHGAEALRALIAVDKQVEVEWGIGTASEATARRTLAAVEARSS